MIPVLNTIEIVTVANFPVPGFNFSELSLPAMQRRFTKARARG